MANTILITANWHTGALSQQTISRQYDNNRYVVQFVGYPEASEDNELDYYLLVWMSSAPGETPDEIAPIQLASDQWYISNVFTQQTQQIKFQMCALNTEGTFEAHSPIFTGFVRNSLEHDGTTQDIDVSTLFDAYREYLNELIIRAGAVVIDSTPTQGSTNAVQSGGVKSALDELQAQIPQIDATLMQSGQAADAKVTGDKIGRAKEDLNDLNSAVFEETISINRFDPSLVTSESVTADKKLYGYGILKDATGIDVTPFLPILPNTEYSMGLVPKYGSAGVPWYGTAICVEFYSTASETSQISRIDRTTNEPITFTSPDNANFYRFNIARASGITLALLASRFMVVFGPSLPDTFSPYGDMKRSKIDILDSAIDGLPSVHFKIENEVLTVTSSYGASSIVVEFGKRGPNNLPDFKTITAEGRNKFNNQTDWFGPFLMSAINNIDGDDITGRTYTGGNHNYANTGSMDSTATARNISLKYYANGEEIVGDVEGDTNRIEIAWVNRIQAYNTKKADGTGREVLEERHKMIYDGRQWEVFTEVEALEAIFCDSYYGMQCYVKDYGTIQMIGANYRLPFPYTTPHDSGNNTPNTYIAFDTNDRLEMEVDRSYDLGKGTMYGTGGTQGFRTASTKGYTYFISQKNMEANAIYGAHGWYRFKPNFI